MNLISCDTCGIVLDKNKLDFPEDIKLEDGSIDTSKAIWVNSEYFAYLGCPVCGGIIINYDQY